MERVLDGLSVPCAFRERGCAAMVPYAARQAHEAECHYMPSHCPIAGCDGDSDRSLRDHVAVRTGCPTAMRMRLDEEARVLCLGDKEEFMLVVDQDMPSGRALSMIRLMDEPVDDEVGFKYRNGVVGAAGVLPLSGQPEEAVPSEHVPVRPQRRLGSGSSGRSGVRRAEMKVEGSCL
jgi:E3 ubiquitin-protein ligase SIAH1